MTPTSDLTSNTEDSPAFWFINSLVTFVANPATTGSPFSICKQVAPSGFVTPMHTHEAYGEGFYVLDGEVTFFCAGKRIVTGKDGFTYLPGAMPHGFRVSSQTPATMMIVSPPESTFFAFVREMGEPTLSRELPVPSQLDFARLSALSAKHGSKTLGPLPS